MEPIARSMAEMMRRATERKAWEEANPEIAAAWNEAREEEQGRREAAAEAKRKAERAAYVREITPGRLRAVGAPPRAVEAWEAGLKRTKAAEAVDKAMNEGKTFCLLKGGTGVGKTVAAVAAMAAVLLADERDDLPCLFVRAVEGARLGLYDAEDKALVGQMIKATVLVVDDLGAEFMSEGSIWRTILDEVIDTRYGDRATTILTTNLDSAAFKARYGERISDRIRHAGIVEECGTGSLRERGEG